MQKLEIVTAHNIVIQTETAELNKRILATFIDYLIIAIVYSILSGLANFHISIHYLLAYPFIVFYHLAFETLNHGQSPGKKMLNIKVISLRGGQPTIEESILRWVFRIVDVAGSIGTLGALMIVSTKNNQRIGDILAQTTVIKLSEESPISLANIERIGFNTPKEFKYPNVIQFNDADFLIVKKAINRFEKNNSNINHQILTNLANKIALKLDVSLEGMNKLTFLKETLQEYILLTR